ncbi:unnamed protein product [Schistosoma margrebowiei]|uniref:Uncharacterized protein n=1 Tax=Schistosoma margrebowiei TaxID=48269 RepID=A0A183LL91_9TREM|nr:unnamed protein product [Schistosoma margrebowiei]
MERGSQSNKGNRWINVKYESEYLSASTVRKQVTNKDEWQVIEEITVDLEYADDIVLFGEDADKMQNLLTTLSNNASMFGMRFSPSKCKMLLQDWVTSTPELVIGSEVVECVDRFTYLGSLISPCGLVCDEISARIQKARLAFANLRHLWRR